MKKWLQHWIFNSYKPLPEHLGLYRIIYATFNLVFLFGFNFLWLSELPDAFFAPPPGVAQIWNGFPSPALLYILNSIVVLSNFALLIGYRTFWTSIIHSLSLLFCFSLVFSLGNIYHIILWLILPLVMAFSNWGTRFSWDELRETVKPCLTGRQAQNVKFKTAKVIRAWPIMLMSLLMGFAFFTAGFAKILGGWLGTEGSAVWQYFVQVHYSVGRNAYLSEWVTQINSPIFWESLDWVVVLFEFGFLLAVFRASLFRVFCVLGVFFHLGILLILDISFAIHLVVFLLFIPWQEIRLFQPSNLSRMDGFFRRIYSTPSWKTAFVAFILIYLTAFYANPFPNKVDGPWLIEWLVFAIALWGIAKYYLRGK